jgi:N-methylhydantoinase A/oxoprolinase/acetone carboxylase beta subunit
MRRVGIDIGGTHTDIVLVDDAGQIVVEKVPTSTGDPSRAGISALEGLLGRTGRSLADVDWFMHGTTIATNIILEHNGARTGLITTAGFRDILHIARHKRPLNFSLQLDLPWQKHQLVARRHRMTVAERVAGPNGDVLVPLDEEAVRVAARALAADGVEAIAVCFLFSFMRPEHEKRAGEIIREEAPGVFVSLSHEVVPQYREYERFSTTALNAFVGPKTGRYLERLDRALAEGGLRTGLHLMQSSGGAATVDAASRRPVNLLMSGPVGGLLGGIWAGKCAGFDDVITLDVGGTSADIGVAPGGEMQFKHLLDTRIGAYHAMVPMAEVDSIGAGGGSIAYVDSAGQFQVGPRSAGAEPGPCCYGRGGTEPTATDCAVVLGRIDVNGFLGGRLPLDAGLSEKAVDERLARPLGLDRTAAALGAMRILTNTMVQAIEMNSVRKGYDPRRFALVAFGGAGGLFACDIARELNVRAVVVPALPGLTSALGLLTSNVAYDFGRTVMKSVAAADPEMLAGAWQELAQEARAQLAADGFSAADMAFLRHADCRYAGQGYELRVAAPAGPIDQGFMAGLRSAYHDEHRRAYGTTSPEKDIEIVNIRLVGMGRIAPIEPRMIEAGGSDPQPACLGYRSVVFEKDGGPSPLSTAIYDRGRLPAGAIIHGPAIVQQMDSTTVLPPGFTGRVDSFANLVIEAV